MRRVTATLAVVGGIVTLAAAAGFWVGRGSAQRDLAQSQELLRLGAQIAAMQLTLTEVAQRPREAAAECGRVEPANLPLLQPAIEAAVRKAFEHHALQAQAELDAKSLPTDENLEAYAQGEQLLDDALKSKRWTDAQAQRLRTIHSRITSEQATGLLQRLAVAVNEGELAIHTDGPPF